MVASGLKPPSTANVAKGFSSRFNHLLDQARFPGDNRIALGAQRFQCSYATFKAWSQSDRMPGTYEALLHIVQMLLKEVPGRHDPRAVTAWLQAGDAVPDPFSYSDDMFFVELYAEISSVGRAYGIDVDRFPRETRNVILRHVRTMLPPNPQSNGKGLQLDKATRSAVVGMLRTASTMAS